MKKAISVLILLLVIVLCSCSLAYENTGSIAVTAAGQNTRSVMPDSYVEPEYYRAQLVSSNSTLDSKDFDKGSNGIVFTNVPFGTYTINVYGYSSADRNVIIAKGTASVQLTTSGENRVSVILSPVSDAQIEDTPLYGTVRINLSFQDGMQLDEIRLVDRESNTIASAKGVVIKEDRSVTFEAEVPAGLDQNLHLEFYSGGELVGMTVEEVYNIYSGQTAVSSQNDGTENDPYSNISFDVARNVDYFEIKPVNELNSLTLKVTIPAYEFDSIQITYSSNGAQTSLEPLTYDVLKDYVGQDYEIVVEGLNSSAEYSFTLRLKHTTGQISPGLVRTAKTATPLGSVQLVYDSDAVSELSPNDKYQFSLSYNPSNATDLGGTWMTSDTSISSIDQNGLLTITDLGTTVVSYTANNGNRTTSVSISVRLVRPELEYELEDSSIRLTWQDCNIADRYEVYRIMNNGGQEMIANSDDNRFSVSGETYTFIDSGISTGNVYRYMVKAIHTSSSNYSESDWTGDISTADPNITIGFEPGPVDLDNIMEGIRQNQVFTTDNPVVIEVKDLADQGIVSYEWYLNYGSDPVSTSRQVTITPHTPGINNTQNKSFQSLMLKVYDEDGYSYSGSLNLYYVDDLDNLPDYDVVTLSTDSGKTRFSSRTSDGGLRTVQLVATAENDLDYFTYSITSGEGIATVDSETGIVTFTDDAFGNVEITASPRYASGKSKSITLDVYRATVTSAVQLVDAVNKVWRDEFVWADGEFGGDWFKTSAQTKSRNGFSFTCKSDLDDDPFCVSINATSNLDQIGESKIRSNGNIDLEWYNIQSGLAGSLGKDGIDTVSTNNQSIVIYLPYNQGTATITYESIRVKDDSGKNTRGGYYSVDFSSDILGIDGVNLDRTGDNKINDATEATNITKLIYG